jgi:hypothetical protein
VPSKRVLRLSGSRLRLRKYLCTPCGSSFTRLEGLLTSPTILWRRGQSDCSRAKSVSSPCGVFCSAAKSDCSPSGRTCRTAKSPGGAIGKLVAPSCGLSMIETIRWRAIPSGLGSRLIRPRAWPIHDNGSPGAIRRSSRLGGLLNFYHREAAFASISLRASAA